MTRPQLNESVPDLALQRSAKSGTLGGSFTLGEILLRPASLENLDYFMKLTQMLSRFFLTHILSKKAKMVGKPHNWIEGIWLALYCTWPLAFLAQLTTGIVFLCIASRRIVGLGMLIMLTLYILDLFVRWIPLGMPGFGFGY
jgi:hypothetical protein